jgi:hypothetical protein
MTEEWILDFNDYSRKKSLENYIKKTGRKELPDMNDFVIDIKDISSEVLQQIKMRSVDVQYDVILAVVRRLMIHTGNKQEHRDKGIRDRHIEESMLYIIPILHD